MDLPLEIVVHGTTLAPEDDAMIRRCIGRFPDVVGRLFDCRVAVQALRPHRGEPPRYTAQVQLVFSAGEISVVESPSVDRFGVIQEALDSAGRKLHDYAVQHPAARGDRATESIR